MALKARFPNPGGKLWPGQFVNVNLTLQTLHDVIAVPAAAVNQGPKGNFVFILGSNGRAVMRPVKVGWTEGRSRRHRLRRAARAKPSSPTVR